MNSLFLFETKRNTKHWLTYLIALLLLCSFLFLISLTLRKKLIVVIGGLLLYVFYMIVLLFSNSPFMAGSIPQSLEAQQISAWLDPFGLSSYFLEAQTFTVHQKNTQVVSFTGYLFLNILLFLIISIGFLFLSLRVFSFSKISKQKIPQIEGSFYI